MLVLRWLLFLAVAFVGAAFVVVAVLSYREYSAKEEAKLAASAPSHVVAVPTRPTLNITPQALADRYNAIAQSVDRRMLLPPVNAMEQLPSNGKFRALRHQVADNVWVVMEIDLASGKPFSLAAWGASSGKASQAVALLAATGMVGVAFTGRPDGGEAITKLCVQAVKAQGVAQEAVAPGEASYCTFAEGMWMSGISVPTVNAKL